MILVISSVGVYLPGLQTTQGGGGDDRVVKNGNQSIILTGCRYCFRVVASFYKSNISLTLLEELPYPQMSHPTQGTFLQYPPISWSTRIYRNHPACTLRGLYQTWNG